MRNSRGLLWGAFAVVVIGLIVGGVAASIGTLARASSSQADLEAAKNTLQRTADNPAALETVAGRASAEAQIRSALVTVDAVRQKFKGSLAMSAARYVPYVGAQRGALVSLVNDTDRATRTALALLQQVDGLTANRTLDSGTIPLPAVQQLAGTTATDATVFRRLVRPASGLVSELGAARVKFNDVATKLATRLGSAREALTAAHTFMGGSSDRTYLLAIENNAEIRDQGSVLSYATVSFSGGRMKINPGGSVQQIALQQPAPPAIPPGMAAIFGYTDPTKLWQSVNYTADFAWSGNTMTAMYRQATGSAVDGVVAVDVPALAALLRVTGPVTVAGIPTPVSGDNVAKLLLHDLYQQPAHREAEADVASAVVDRLTHGRLDLVTLGRALADAAAGGHIRLYSTVASEERAFEQTGLGGGPAAAGDPTRTFHLAVENRTATKLDFYASAQMRQAITLTTLGTAIVHTTVTIVNAAPLTGDSVYQVGPDAFGSQQQAGDYAAWVLLWGPAGSVQEGSVAESGLRLSPQITTAAAGQTTTVTFTTVIPRAVRDGQLVLRYVPQPRLTAESVDITLFAPGWTVGGSARRALLLDRINSVTWTLNK